MLIRILRIFAGTLLILIAIIGFVTPIIPGWPFAIAGAIMIKPAHKEKIIKEMKILQQKTHRWVQDKHAWLKKILGRSDSKE